MDSNRLAVPSFAAVESLLNTLLSWLRMEVFPLWDQRGIDRTAGGYFEQLVFDEMSRTIEATGPIRRGRVVARQIYVFETAHQWGWRSTLSNPVRHGCEYLFSSMHRGDGVFHTAVDAATKQPQLSFSLYEQAFYLFALAKLKSSQGADFPIADTAERCLRQLRSTWGKVNGGFNETAPPSVPLKSNPHMHLLESALAWVAVTEGRAQRPWVELAKELVHLGLAYFVDPKTGAVREYFDADWHPMPDASGRIVEPGHQFEWAWLLMEWESSGHCSVHEGAECRAAARRLVAFAERWGVDGGRGVAVNELWDDGVVKDAAAKLWPQTERVKAWCAMLEAADGAETAESACGKLAAATRGMARYLHIEPAGLWREVLAEEGVFHAEPVKASSLYHVVCAVDVLRKTVDSFRAAWPMPQ